MSFCAMRCLVRGTLLIEIILHEFGVLILVLNRRGFPITQKLALEVRPQMKHLHCKLS